MSAVVGFDFGMGIFSWGLHLLAVWLLGLTLGWLVRQLSTQRTRKPCFQKLFFQILRVFNNFFTRLTFLSSPSIAVTATEMDQTKIH